MKKNIQSIYYHDPKPYQLDRLLNRYISKGFRFISIDDLYCILSNKKEINENLCFLSFDDGWLSNLDLLPVIEKYNVPICIFVATEPLESGNYWWEFITAERGLDGMIKFKSLSYEDFYTQLDHAKRTISLNRSSMTYNELKDIANHPLVSIQSHTVNHPILTNVPTAVLRNELVQSKQILEDLCGKEIFAFSYPNGSLSEREVSETSRIYKIAFTTEQRHISINDNIYLLPRVALTGDYYRDLLKIYGVWPVLKKIVGWLK